MFMYNKKRKEAMEKEIVVSSLDVAYLVSTLDLTRLNIITGFPVL